MACPYFLPQAPLKEFSDLYSGTCAAESASAIASEMIETCNRGYGRDKCARAALSESDAFRFLVKSQADGVVQIAWSSERDHHPVGVGVIAVQDDASGASPLEIQAGCVANEFLRQCGTPD